MFKKLNELWSGDSIVYFYEGSYSKGIVDKVEGGTIYLLSGIAIELLSEYMEVYVIPVKEISKLGSSLLVGDEVLLNRNWYTVLSLSYELQEYGMIELKLSECKKKVVYMDMKYPVRIP
jgi:hypothetical protein